MEVVYPRCAGLDVHKKTLTACVLISYPGHAPAKAIRSFGTFTDDLLSLAAWLRDNGVTKVAMESTGVFWQPVWNILEEEGFDLLLANAQHVKRVPGRKTDVGDSEWLADLLRHGLLKGSFVPGREERELRELVRYRSALVRERTAEVNRLQKTLEGANLKLGSVASNVVGASGRAMLGGLLAGTRQAEELADLAKGQLRKQLPQLARALAGRFGAHQQFMLAQQLGRIDALDEDIARLDEEVQARTRPFAPVVEHLDAIPGVGRRTAEVIVTEVGVEMARFPTPGHLASWAGMCPGNNQSGGRRLGGKTRKANRYLRSALAEAAQAAARSKHNYLSAQFHRLCARRGYKKAVIAVGHSILTIAYHLLKDPNEVYRDLGPTYYDQREREVTERRLVRRLEGLGYTVTLQPAA